MNLLWRAEAKCADGLGGGRDGTRPVGAICRGIVRQLGKR